ncbi:thioredoxin-domain-containing protein [Cryphonectria parasitica EP155]|uniref:Thioredoxin-domain-containing protein n=1 Tax=Cryphonectria parasitica (strain ATCC 38755 / EP155) TaxID=660469 RepID=A0A9P4YDA1_CRYP1|nr:thioredoxin-domain-containing protein [Cryphonectria parasitica EP155]KAF3770963.1 thioredoxin-domain-containing protein [Cryphonectria parasitica EP155]
MDTIIVMILAAIAWFVFGPALLRNRTPIPETSGKVHKITKPAELDALLKATTHVVVDFYADWCPPCRAIAPVFSKLADDHAAQGQLAFAKVNVDHVNAVSARYGVSAMPTFVFFEDGQPTPVADVEKVRQSPSVVLKDGGVERIRGADRNALVAVVEALAVRVTKTGGVEEMKSK